jgi:aspartate-semialdehyde dehydrogenase
MLLPLASERSLGKLVSFHGKEIPIQVLDEKSFENIDIALFSAGGSISLKYGPIAAASGAVVVDNSSAFRMEPDIPLVVPEVNPNDIALYTNRGIIANPNCSTIQMVVVLKPIHARPDQTGDEFYVSRPCPGPAKKRSMNWPNRCEPCSVGRRKSKFIQSADSLQRLPHIDVFLKRLHKKK